MNKWKRLRGLRTLVGEMVEHGSKAVEDVHVATAARTFVVLEAITPIAKPAKVVHVVHDAYVGSVYGIIRAVTRVVGKTADVALDVAEGSARSDRLNAPVARLDELVDAVGDEPDGDHA